jgi:hypothetical protein
MQTKTSSETDKARDAFALRTSGFPLIAARMTDEDRMRNLLVRRAAQNSARRFTGEPQTELGGL